MPSNHRIEEVLAGFKEGRVTLEDTVREISGLRIDMVAGMANLDAGRKVRCGIPEVILAEGKTPAQVTDITEKAVKSGRRIIVSRLSPDHSAALETLSR